MLKGLQALVQRLGLLDEACAQAYFTRLEWGNALCFKMLFAKLLSIAVIAGASIVKVPQILNIHRKGAKGLSFASLLLEIVGYLIVISHAVQSGFSLDAYAESFFVLFQSKSFIDTMWEFNFCGDRFGHFDADSQGR